MSYTLTSIKQIPFTSKEGKPYTRLIITTAERAGIEMSGLVGKENEHWKVGDKVELLIEQKGQYTNFKAAKPADLALVGLEALEVRVLRLEGQMKRV